MSITATEERAKARVAARKAFRRKLRHTEIEQHKKPLAPASHTSMTTPAGIAVNSGDVDPERYDNQLRARHFAGELSKGNGQHKGKQDDEPAESWQESPSGAIVALPIGECERHEDNRQPAEHEIMAMMQSLTEVKQLEPLVVWQATQTSRYTILSGETRWRAAKRLGWQTIQARIVTGIDAAQALQLLARYNGERKDLDPIQRARLGKRLTTPAAEGGGGLTQQKAAEQLGLEKGASLANLMKLLELPAKWQERVAAGELPWSWAREMAAALVLAPVDRELDREWKRKDSPTRQSYEGNAFDSRRTLMRAIEHSIRSDCRRLDEKNYIGSSWKAIDIDAANPAIRKELGIVEVELPDGGRGKTKTVAIATNVKAFDAIKEKQQERAEKKRAERGGRDDKPAERKLSAGELKQRAADRTRQLTDRINRWRHRWLRKLIVARLTSPGESNADECAATEASDKLIVWLATGPLHSMEYGHVKLWLALNGGNQHDVEKNWRAIAQLPCGDLYETAKQLAIALLSAEERNDWRFTVPPPVVDGMAEICGIELAEEWDDLQGVPGAKPTAQLEEFFLLHQTEQLRGLAGELKVFAPQTATRGAIVKLLLAKISGTTRLPLPKSIKRLPVVKERQPSKPKVS